MTAEQSDARDWDAEVGEPDNVRRVFEELPLVLLAVEGPEHRIVAANAKFRGMSRRRPIGLPAADVLPDLQGQHIFELYDRVLRTGEPLAAREWRLALDVSGRGEPTDFYFDFVVHPRRDDDGAVVGAAGYGMNVTERVRDRLGEQERAAIAERRYEQARDVITALQRELLPPGLPVVPGARTAACYLPADPDTSAGGDWFDGMVLPGGRLAMVVGDVVGHGVTASATMGQLRAVLHDRLTESGDIAAALAALDRTVQRLPSARAATVSVAVLDPASGSLSYCTAGHPPPLLIDRCGESRYLAATGAGPLGSGRPFTVGTGRLAEGEVLVLFSDGLVERPGREPAESLVELAQVARNAADRTPDGAGLSTVERVCSRTLEFLLRPTGHTDDITILAVQRVAPPTPLRLDVRAGLPAISTSYVAVSEWAEQLGLAPQDVSAIRHAVCELVTNCVDHAYGGQAGGVIHIQARLDHDGFVRVEVADRGRWLDRVPHASGRSGGLGLVLIDRLVDELRLERTDEGTTAKVALRGTTPGRFLTVGEITPCARAVRPPPQLLLVLDQPHAPEPRIRVDGPLTALTVDHFAKELQRLTRNGTRPLIVDMAGVSLLASAGVAALQQALQRGGDLRLYAPNGSVAQHVLTLTALPHMTNDPHGDSPRAIPAD